MPVSVMPEVAARTVVPAAPYVTVWSIPTNVFAGDADVIGLCDTPLSEISLTHALLWTYTNVSGPVNLVSSMPPKVSSPFVDSSDCVGAKAMPISCAPIKPWLNALSVTVGMHSVTAGNSVPVDACDYLRIIQDKVVAYRMSDPPDRCWRQH